MCPFSVLPFMRQTFFDFAHPYVGQWSMKIKAPWLSSYLGITMLIDSFFFCSTSIFSWPWNQFEFQYLYFAERRGKNPLSLTTWAVILKIFFSIVFENHSKKPSFLARKFKYLLNTAVTNIIFAAKIISTECLNKF